MPQVTVQNVAGKSAGKVELDEAMFGIKPNVAVLHQVITAQLAARRAGTQSTKTRSEVRGGGAKPYRQKGTGNARQGSIRSPQFVGGGVALGPKPRKYNQKTPKKMIKLALRSALSDRAAEGKIIVVDKWGWESPSTKSAKAALAGLGIDGSALVVVGRDDGVAVLSFRNLPDVQLTEPNELSAYDVLSNEYVIFTESLLPTSAPAEAKSVAETPAAEVEPDEVVTEEVAVAEVDAETAEVVGDAADAVAQWSGSVPAVEDGSQPEGYDIKGNADSMLYHLPNTSFYNRTVAEVWFDTAENAEAAGFQLPPSQREAAEAPADDVPPDEGSASDESDGGSGQSEAEAGPDHEKDES
jgi:large subunit ribosomal protein L4